MSEKFEIIDTKFANGFKVCVSDKEQKGAPITSFIGKNLFIFSDDDLKEIYTEGIIRISVYRAGDNQLFIRVEELDAGNIWLLKKDPKRPGAELKWKGLLNEIALGTGFGLRYDISYLVIRADLGIGIHTPYPNPDKTGYYNISSFKDGLGFHLAIGYPF